MNAGPFTLLGAEPSILSLSWIHDALLMFTDINSVFCRYKPKLPIHFLLFYPVFDGVSSYYNRLPSEAFLVRTALPALDHINCISNMILILPFSKWRFKVRAFLVTKFIFFIF